MIQLFKMGGPLFMGILTLLLVIILVRVFQVAFNKSSDGISNDQDHIGQIKTLGVLSLVIGVLGAFIGLFSAFSTIEEVGSVSQGVLATLSVEIMARLFQVQLS